MGKKTYKSHLVLLVSLLISKGLLRMTEGQQEPSLGVCFGMVQMGIFSEGSFISNSHKPRTPNPHLWLNKLVVHCSIKKPGNISCFHTTWWWQFFGRRSVCRFYSFLTTKSVTMNILIGHRSFFLSSRNSLKKTKQQNKQYWCENDTNKI